MHVQVWMHVLHMGMCMWMDMCGLCTWVGSARVLVGGNMCGWFCAHVWVCM